MLFSTTIAVATLLCAASGAAIPSGCTNTTLLQDTRRLLISSRFRNPSCRPRRVLRVDREQVPELHRS
jgi:hypothetical protein